MTSLRAALSQSAGARRPGGRFVLREPAFKQLREALAYGLLNAAFVIEDRSKHLTPVHGDPAQGGPFSTFAPGAKPMGGTLRRSLHSLAYVDGRPIAGSATTESLFKDAGDKRDELSHATNGQPVVAAAPAGGIAAIVGTAVEYAGFVHDGTVHMAARPFLARALAETADDVPGLITAGARRHLGMGGSGGATRTSSGRARDARGRFTSSR